MSEEIARIRAEMREAAEAAKEDAERDFLPGPPWPEPGHTPAPMYVEANAVLALLSALDAAEARAEATPVFQIVNIDDWSALYINGNSVAQGHSISPNEIADHAKGAPFILRPSIGADGTPLEEWAHDCGELPETLSEAIKIARIEP